MREGISPKKKMSQKLTGSPADVNRLVHIAEAKSYALKLLGYRSRSEKEMTERLKKKGFDGTVINSVVKFLKDTGLIKDEALAAELLNSSLRNKYLGKRGIKSFLYSRGIRKDLIAETLSSLSEDAEKETALRLAGRKMKILRRYPQDIVKRRLGGMLQRRGFSADIINEVIKSFNR